MLFNKTNNKLLIGSFNVLTEVIIGFSTFALFFGVFMNYFFTKYEVQLLGEFIKQSISFYKGVNNYNNDKSQTLKIKLNQLISKNQNITKLEADVAANEEEVHSYNKPYDNKLMYIILIMIFGLVGILLLPILTGLIRFDQINLKYIGFSTLLHIILIVGFELLFLLYIITFINPVKLYSVFQNNYSKTGSYI